MLPKLQKKGAHQKARLIERSIQCQIIGCRNERKNVNNPIIINGTVINEIIGTAHKLTIKLKKLAPPNK